MPARFVQSHSAGHLSLNRAPRGCTRVLTSSQRQLFLQAPTTVLIPSTIIYYLIPPARFPRTLIVPRMAAIPTSRNAPITRTAMLTRDQAETNGRREHVPEELLRSARRFYSPHHSGKNNCFFTTTTRESAVSFFGSDVIPKLLARLPLPPAVHARFFV